MLNVIVITQEDPIYVGTFWEEFVRLYRSHSKREFNITLIVSEKPLGKDTKIDLFKRVYNFYGVIDTLKLGLRFLHTKIKGHGIEYYARLLDAQFKNNIDPNNPEFIEVARRTDIVMSVAASSIFKRSLLNAPKEGVFNIHSGALPDYRGMMPVFWQMLDGKKEVGITIHRVDEKIDHGNIVLQKMISIDHLRSLHQAILYTKKKAAGIMFDFLNNFEKYKDKELIHTGSSVKSRYFSFPTRKDAQKFRKMGYKLI